MSEIKDSGTAPKPRRGLTPRFGFAAAATAGVAAVAVAAVVIGTGALGTDEPAQEAQESSDTALTPVGQTFELAASYAANQSFETPGEDQWIYVKTRGLATGSVAQDKGQDPDTVFEEWTSVDGTELAAIDPETGELSVWEQENYYPFLSTLPTDPEQLLEVLREDITQNTGDKGDSPADSGESPEPGIDDGSGGDQEGADVGEGTGEEAPMTEEDINAELFSRVIGALGYNLLSPEVTAALWQAAALIPGATEMETVTVDGRELLAVGRIQEGWRFEQLLVDPESYEFVGIRSEAVKDHTFDGGNGPVEIAEGEVQFEIIRLDAAVVDEPGETG
ncbi:hypothetical protein [Stackebrandtia albiflava]|nr:hypothetical protein [Stackebrandtia albiflava]